VPLDRLFYPHHVSSGKSQLFKKEEEKLH